VHAAHECRFGSFADIVQRKRAVRLALDSGVTAGMTACQLSAITRHTLATVASVRVEPKRKRRNRLIFALILRP
jgi:hypothetical protein